MENDLCPRATLRSARMKAGMNLRVGTPLQGQTCDRDGSPEAPPGLWTVANSENPLRAIQGARPESLPTSKFP